MYFIFDKYMKYVKYVALGPCGNAKANYNLLATNKKKLDKSLGVCFFNIYRWGMWSNIDPFWKRGPHIGYNKEQACTSPDHCCTDRAHKGWGKTTPRGDRNHDSYILGLVLGTTSVKLTSRTERNSARVQKRRLLS